MSEPCNRSHVYRPRIPRTSPLWQLLDGYFETDPLLCECGGRLRIVAFLDDPSIVQRILRHVCLLDDGLVEPNGRAPPEAAAADLAVEPILDDLAPDYDSAD